jgi:hypothetical protein
MRGIDWRTAQHRRAMSGFESDGAITATTIASRACAAPAPAGNGAGESGPGTEFRAHRPACPRTPERAGRRASTPSTSLRRPSSRANTRQTACNKSFGVTIADGFHAPLFQGPGHPMSSTPWDGSTFDMWRGWRVDPNDMMSGCLVAESTSGGEQWSERNATFACSSLHVSTFSTALPVMIIEAGPLCLQPSPPPPSRPPPPPPCSPPSLPPPPHAAPPPLNCSCLDALSSNVPRDATGNLILTIARAMDAYAVCSYAEVSRTPHHV